MGFGGIFQANKASFREIILKNTLKRRKNHSIGNIKMLFIFKKKKEKEGTVILPLKNICNRRTR